jgi:hypothetical protein
VSPARRRRAVQLCCERLGMSQRRACEIVGQHRSTQRHRPAVHDPDRDLRRTASLLGPRSGLIKQLMYEKFTQADATYGADALNADWNQQAAKKAAEYLDYSSFSHSGLIEQLVYEGFTQAQAEYGVGTTGL